MKKDKKLIMLVEDNYNEELLTVQVLKDNNIRPEELAIARDGEEAIDYLFGKGKYSGRNLDIMPDLILLDLKLPKLNGFEVLKHLRLSIRTRTIPVIILSSSKENDDLINSYKSGANSYIQKSMDFEYFKETIKHLLLYWLKINEIPEN